MKRLLYLVAVGTALGILGASVIKDRDAREAERARSADAAERPPTPSPPRAEREPRFVFAEGLDKPRRAKAELALQAIYDRCSKYAVFREGAQLEAAHVPFGGKGEDDVVAASVKLPDAARTRGNTLWYQVWFVDGWPSTMVALKPISAELCGFVAERAPERIE